MMPAKLASGLNDDDEIFSRDGSGDFSSLKKSPPDSYRAPGEKQSNDSIKHCGQINQSVAIL